MKTNASVKILTYAFSLTGCSMFVAAVFAAVLFPPIAHAEEVEQVPVAKKDMRAGTEIRAHCVTMRPMEIDYGCEGPQPMSKFIGRVLKFDVYRGQALHLCDIGINPSSRVRCLQAVRNIRKGEKITRQNVRQTWKQLGKGDPTGPLPDLPNALGKQLRWDFLQDSILEDHDLQQSDSSRGNNHE